MEGHLPVAEARIRELELKVAGLERQLHELGNEDPDTSVEDWIDGFDRRLIAELLRHLEMVIPDFSIRHLRTAMEELELQPTASEGDPMVAMLAAHTRLRIAEHISEALPASLYEGEDPLEGEPAQPRHVLYSRLVAEQRTRPSPHE